jgi:hypothetical protein|tara:strand:- start:1304 stop:1594 length:291 start_codon:yes stop_codon:yes gene_type:complete
MKIGPFKMKGFSGFKDESPAKHNDQGMFTGTGQSKPMMAMVGAQAGQALVTKENRKRKGIETGFTKKGMDAIGMVKKNTKNRMGALDMFSGFKNFF